MIAKVRELCNLNKIGKTADAVELYEDMKEKGLEFSLLDYNQIISSFAPRKLMWEAFKELKDFTVMYKKVGEFNPRERVGEAQRIFDDIRSRSKLEPDVISFNCLMKVQLSGGAFFAEKTFVTLNQMLDAGIKPNIATYSLLLRACAILNKPDEAKSLYRSALSNFPPTEISIQFHNTMLDVFAELGSIDAIVFFEHILKKSFLNPGPDGMTFNIIAKAFVMRGERHKLMQLAEQMRVHGVLQRELSSHVRREIFDSYKVYSTSEKSRLTYSHSIPSITDPHYIDPFEEVRDMLIGEIVTSTDRKEENKDEKRKEERRAFNKREGSD